MLAEEHTNWPHGHLTQKIIAASLEVSAELGHGFLESVYHSALVLALSEASLEVAVKPVHKIRFRNTIVGSFTPDLVVEGVVLIEIKAIHSLAPEHQAQVINYLRATQLDVGLLLNFGRPRLEIRRLHR